MAEPVRVINLQAWRKRAVQHDPAPQAPSSVRREAAFSEPSAAAYALPMAFFAFWPAFAPPEAAQWPRRRERSDG